MLSVGIFIVMMIHSECQTFSNCYAECGIFYCYAASHFHYCYAECLYSECRGATSHGGMQTQLFPSFLLQLFRGNSGGICWSQVEAQNE
jgi:hypothetical protein